MKNKKTKLIVIGIVALILVTIGLTYAYWLVTKTQTNENVISSACLDIEISGEKNDITLTNQFPMSDEDGMKLVPYEFTVTNNCNTSIDYQVALEAMGESSTAIASNALKVALDDAAKLYSEYSNSDITVAEAYEAKMIKFSKLAASGSEGSSVTHKLRVWIDEDAPISEANKTFRSKISVTIGQGIENPYEVGTIAYDILANYGGSGNILEIDATKLTQKIGAIQSIYMSVNREYYWGTEYIYDELTGEYKVDGELTLATVEECRAGQKGDGTTINCGKYTAEKADKDYAEDYFFTEIVEWTHSSGNNYVTGRYLRSGLPFNAAGHSASLNKTQDDLGDTYYFRGAVTNNYVKFGTHVADQIVIRGYASETSTIYQEYKTLSECNSAATHNYNCTEYKYASAGDPMYWRIMRINGDGTIRLIYDGIEKFANGVAHDATIGQFHYNYNYDDTFYMDYYVSDLRSELNSWYVNNLKNRFDSYIADGIYCSDSELGKITDSTINYAAYDRLNTEHAPTLKCINKNNAYTVDDTINGNGNLENPIGTLTADEATFAGGYGSANKQYYLYTGANYRTMTPYYFYQGHDSYLVGGYVYGIKSDGVVGSLGVNGKHNVRPVINLKADVKFTGSGTIDNPYVIVTD